MENLDKLSLLIPFSKALHLSMRINTTFLVVGNFSLPAVQHQHEHSRILGDGRDEKRALAAWRPIAKTLYITFMQNRNVVYKSPREPKIWYPAKEQTCGL